MLKKSLILKSLNTGKERIVDPPVKFYWHEKTKEMIAGIGSGFLKDMPRDLSNAILDITLRLVTPNITPNRSESEKESGKPMTV